MKIAKCFRETVGNNLKINHKKIYPEDTKYDLLFPLGLLDLKVAVDSFDLYGMMKKAGHPITMEQADEMISELSNIETISEKIKYLSKLKKQG